MLESALNGWQEWGLKSEPTLIKTFTKGKNHHAGLIESAGAQYVLKVFNHSFESAINAQMDAAKHDIAPKVFYRGENTALMALVNDVTPSLKEVANSLRVLHQQVRSDAQGLELLGFFQRYLTNAPDTLRAKHKELLPVVSEFIDDPTPWCFCHNDLVTENCLRLDGNAVFIDWEFAAQHNPWFDLAAIILYRELNTQQAAEFLKHYQGWQHKVNERIFLSSQITLLWGDLLWHVDKYGLDYQAEYPIRFQKLEKLNKQLKNNGPK